MSDPASSVSVSFDVPATMRDGTVLVADVYTPAAGDGPWPTLLLRTPYGKGTVVETAWSGIDPVKAARSGFVVVIQDVRGRHASGGAWEPLQHEGEDGFDTVEWAATLPGSNGRVGLFGGSYCGNTQWQAAVARPPSLVAMAPLMTWSDPADGLYSRGGAMELGLVLPWSLLTGADDVARRLGDDPTLGDRIEAIVEEYDHLLVDGYTRPGEVVRQHDVPEIGTLRAATLGAVRDDPADLSGRQGDAGVPAFHTAGWFDLFLQGTLDNHRATTERGVETRLVIGPWTHEDFGDAAGELSFGLRAGRETPFVHPVGRWEDAQLAWLRRHLEPASEPPPVEDDPPVRVFVMGRNEWRNEESWPPQGVEEVAWFLRADGGLSVEAPTMSQEPITYFYDLGHPVPTVGGATLMTSDFPSGPRDQRVVEARTDVVSFTSDVLTEDLEVAGRVLAHLHAQSSASAADWVVRLCDVHPDGRSINVCDGVTRVGEAHAADEHAVDLWSTHQVFLAGHRVRIDVANSSFPRWDLARGEDGTGVGAETARVFTDAARPSRIVLPVRTVT
jgi:putative CocE/NonD family hydrolase